LRQQRDRLHIILGDYKEVLAGDTHETSKESPFPPMCLISLRCPCYCNAFHGVFCPAWLLTRPRASIIQHKKIHSERASFLRSAPGNYHHIIYNNLNSKKGAISPIYYLFSSSRALFLLVTTRAGHFHQRLFIRTHSWYRREI